MSQAEIDAEDRIIVGIQPVREAIRAGAVTRVSVDQQGNPRLAALERFAQDQGIEVRRLSRQQLDTVGMRHQGVIARARPLAVHQDVAEVPDDALFIILDGITDPQNFGAVIRSAVALGATGIIWGEHGAAPLTPATFRASAGAVEHATLYCVRSLRGALDSLASAGAKTVALVGGADADLHAQDLTGPVALVVGAEDVGVSRGVRRQVEVAAKLSMEPTIDSLNASVAAALALYEVRRQRLK